MAGTIAPFPKHVFLTNAGDPAVGYKLFCYAAGTTTKINTYSNAEGTSANANPIILDAAGRATIFGTPGLTYTFVLAPPTDTDPPTSPLWTVPGVQSVPTSGANVDVSGVAGETLTANQLVYIETGSGGTAGRWYKASSFFISQSADAPVTGFVLASAATGAAITVRKGGRLVVAGPLTPGSIYYASDTSGAIETPAPSPETAFEMPFAVAFADTSTSIVFPLSQPPMWSRDALRTIAFGSGQGNEAGGGDTELDSYDTFIPGNYCNAAGNAIVIEGTMTVAANGDAKTVKIKVGSGTLTTIWSSSANVANHVVPFRIVIRRRTSTTGSVTALFYHGVATATDVANVFMTYTTLGTLDWTGNQVLNLYSSANTINSVVMNDLTTYGILTQNGAVV